MMKGVRFSVLIGTECEGLRQAVPSFPPSVVGFNKLSFSWGALSEAWLQQQ